MTDTSDTGNTEFVLPIICPHCKEEVNLGMIFSLLASEKKEEEEEEEEIGEINGKEDEDDLP